MEAGAVIRHDLVMARLDPPPGDDDERRWARHPLHMLPAHHQWARLCHARHYLDGVIDGLGHPGDLHERTQRSTLRVRPISLYDPKIGARILDDDRRIGDHASNDAPDRDDDHDQQRNADRGAKKFEPVVADIADREVHSPDSMSAFISTGRGRTVSPAVRPVGMSAIRSRGRRLPATATIDSRGLSASTVTGSRRSTSSAPTTKTNIFSPIVMSVVRGTSRASFASPTCM